MEDSVDRLEKGEISSSSFVAQAFNQQQPPSNVSATNKPDKDTKSSAQLTLELLNQRQRELERDLRAAVCANSDELLQNATDVKFLRDNVTNLKSQLTRARKETEVVSATLLSPFSSIQTSAIQLNSIYGTCKELIVLLRFLALVKSAKPNFIQTKIDRMSSDIRGLCEMQKIANGGEINNIVVFQKLWAKVKPNCEKMINLAEKQFTESIEKLNLELASSAASVFICLGTIETVSLNNFNKYVRLMNQNRYDKCSADTIFSNLQTDFSNLATNVSNVVTLQQSISNAILKNSEPDILNFDISLVAPIKAITEYSATLKKSLNRISNQYPNIGNELVIKIPMIRKELLAIVAKFPSSIDQSSAFSIIISVFAAFQDAFVKQTSEEIKKMFFKSFSSANSDTKAISLNCEAIQNRLSRFDKDLLLKFKESIVNLANHFVKMKNAPKESLRKAAIDSQEAVANNLQSLASKLFSDDVGSQISAILA